MTMSASIKRCIVQYRFEVHLTSLLYTIIMEHPVASVNFKPTKAHTNSGLQSYEDFCSALVFLRHKIPLLK